MLKKISDQRASAQNRLTRMGDQMVYPIQFLMSPRPASKDHGEQVTQKGPQANSRRDTEDCLEDSRHPRHGTGHIGRADMVLSRQAHTSPAPRASSQASEIFKTLGNFMQGRSLVLIFLQDRLKIYEGRVRVNPTTLRPKGRSLDFG